MLSGALSPPANSLRKYSPHPCLWGDDQAPTLGHSRARTRTQTPRFPHCTAALPWTRGQAHLLLLAISSLCLSIVSIKSINWGQSQAEPVRAQSLLTPHGWQERRPTSTEAAGHQGAEPHPRRGRPRGKSTHPAERHQNKRLPLGPRYWLLGEAPELRGREGGHGMGAEGGSLSTQLGRGKALRSEAASSLPAWTSLPGGAAPPC